MAYFRINEERIPKGQPKISLRCVSPFEAITLFTLLEAALAKSLPVEGVSHVEDSFLKLSENRPQSIVDHRFNIDDGRPV